MRLVERTSFACLRRRHPSVTFAIDGPRVDWGRDGQKKKGSKLVASSLIEENPGDVLLSHTAARAVPSAPKSLTTEFGMGSGVASSKSSPETCGSSHTLQSSGVS